MIIIYNPEHLNMTGAESLDPLFLNSGNNMCIRKLKSFLRELREKYPEEDGRHNFTLNPYTDQLELNIRLNETTRDAHIIILSEEDEEGSLDALLEDVIKLMEL